jgi:predicted RNA binding protein YcfA (HicA-like mRNA interferase family)
MPYTNIPALKGAQLIHLLQKDGWETGRKSTHGRTLTKRMGDRVRVTVIPEKKSSLADYTLALILGPKQTGIGKHGLLELLNKYGLT